MMHLTLNLVIAASVVTILVAAAAAKPVTYVFGDSLSEVGNNNYLPQSLAKANYPWYGVDYTGGKPTGRFTNGRTIGDIICMSTSKLCLTHPHAVAVPSFFPFYYAQLCAQCYVVAAAEKLGIPSPPPYLSLPSNDDKLLEGINYASGGAGILNETGLYFVISQPSFFNIIHRFGSYF